MAVRPGRRKVDPERPVARHERNPGELLTFGANPGGTKGAKRLGVLHKLYYEHDTEGPRVHEFDGTEVIELLRDGSVRIYHPSGVALWAEHPD